MTEPIDRKKLRADEKKFLPRQWFAVRLKEPSAVGVGQDTGPTMEKVEYLSCQEHEALLKEAKKDTYLKAAAYVDLCGGIEQARDGLLEEAKEMSEGAG